MINTLLFIKKIGYCLFLITSFILINPSIPIFAHKSSEIVILEADYTDADKDQSFDDIILKFRVSLKDKLLDDENDDFRLKLKLTIELPSGYQFQHQFDKINIKTDKTTFLITAFNTANEAGWYIATIYGKLYQVGGKNLLLEDSVVFDPPGGKVGFPDYVIEEIK